MSKRAVYVAVNKKTGPSLKCYRLYGVTFVLTFVFDDRIERRSFGQWAELCPDQNLLSHCCCTHFPFSAV